MIAVNDHHDDQNRKRNKKVHQTGKNAGKRQDHTGKIDFCDHIPVRNKGFTGIAHGIFKQLPRHQPRKRKERVRDPVRRDFRKTAKENRIRKVMVECFATQPEQTYTELYQAYMLHGAVGQAQAKNCVRDAKEFGIIETIPSTSQYRLKSG